MEVEARAETATRPCSLLMCCFPVAHPIRTQSEQTLVFSEVELETAIQLSSMSAALPGHSALPNGVTKGRAHEASCPSW